MACISSSVIGGRSPLSRLSAEGLPGCLFITAANPYETSHADVWSEDVGVYLSNGFTRDFQDAIAQNHDISLRDLYYALAAHTTGSHVKVYNAPHFGSVYSNTMAEFMKDTSGRITGPDTE